MNVVRFMQIYFFKWTGKFEGEEEIGFEHQQTLAAINSRTGMFATRFIFSAKEKFIYIAKNGTIGNKENLKSDILMDTL